MHPREAELSRLFPFRMLPAESILVVVHAHAPIPESLRVGHVCCGTGSDCGEGRREEVRGVGPCGVDILEQRAR
eukprot:292322-Chlamydomonas_euryale.AAC.9